MDDVGRALAMIWEEEHGDTGNNPWSLKNISKIKEEFDIDPEKTKNKYPELFYYYNGMVDTIVSQSIHPAGMVICPISLSENYGVFDKDGENCLMIDMDEAHEVGVAKYDFLILKTVQVIRDTCNYIGVDYPKTYQIDWLDEKVWENMGKNLNMIFQFESEFAATCFKKMKPQSIQEMSLVTASIRPSGDSYRDALLSRKIHKNPSEIIDKLLEENMGYLVYQEDTIKFLQEICGFSGGDADTIRRGIGRKRKEILDAAMPQILDGYCNKSPLPRDEAEKEAQEFLQILEDSASYQFNKSHSIAYCLLGYLCGYYRYYYPLEFITSYLNNAANDTDVKNGTQYANSIGIKVTMPRWGASKDEYYFNKEKNIIAQGLSVVKYMSPNVSRELYELSQKTHFTRFVDLLAAINKETSLNTRQLDILIKLDFFSEFGNQRELLYLTSMYYDTFKKGDAKQIKKDIVDGTPLEPIVTKYAVGTTKSGGVAKSYTLLDVQAILQDIEKCIKATHLEEIDILVRCRNFYDIMGYIGYVSGQEEDRRKLFILNVFPVARKKDGKVFGQSIITKSIGSGKECRMTVFNRLYDENPIHKGDIIYCKSWEKENGYFRLTGYDLI